jgi:HSP20 family protein
MNLVKRLLHPRNEHSIGGTALAKRENSGGLLSRKDRFGFDRVEDLWRDFERDPWSIVRDPWSMFDRMSERLSELAPWPAVDVSEDESSVTVRCDVPGLDANDLDVEVSGNLLTIRGSRQDEWSDSNKKRGVRRQERVIGSFARTITLPSYVDASNVDAKYEKGTLTLTVPKIPGKCPRRIEVKSA